MTNGKRGSASVLEGNREWWGLGKVKEHIPMERGLIFAMGEYKLRVIRTSDFSF